MPGAGVAGAAQAAATGVAQPAVAGSVATAVSFSGVARPNCKFPGDAEGRIVYNQNGQFVAGGPVLPPALPAAVSFPHPQRFASYIPWQVSAGDGAAAGAAAAAKAASAASQAVGVWTRS